MSNKSDLKARRKRNSWILLVTLFIFAFLFYFLTLERISRSIQTPTPLVDPPIPLQPKQE